MSTALYQKDTASRLRAQLRRKAISLYYNNKGPQMTYGDVAKKMQLPQKYIEKWITRYEKTGLHGYVGQRQSAILCIYKKNPNITLSQLRILLKKVGIVLSNNELSQILKNLKHILTDPMFKSASEEQILRKLSKVTKVQAKSVIRMNQKMKLEKEKEDGKNYPYTLHKRSVYLDHSYVAYPELSYDENDYSLYDNVDTLAKYKTDLMNKIASVSKNLEKLFDTNSKKQERKSKDIKSYKISLLREQLLYLCLEMKGPKLTVTEVTQNLPLTEVIVNKWIEQAKSIKRFVHAKHVNKCCGKIQESIVRLVKLNSELTTEEVKNILHHVNIDLSNLKLERQLNSVKYMINGPEIFVEKEHEDMEIKENDLDYCIKVLSMKITSVNMKKTKRQKGEKIISKQLSLQNIIESCSSEKYKVDKNKIPGKIQNDHIYENPSLNNNYENRIEFARNNLHEELTNILNNNEKYKQHNETLNNKNIFNGKMNGLNILQAVTLNEMAKYGLSNEGSSNENCPVKVEFNQTVNELKSNRIDTVKYNEDVNLLQYISMGSNNYSFQNSDYFNNEKHHQIDQSQVIEEHIYNIDLKEHNIPYEDTVKENTFPNLLMQKESLFDNKFDQQVNHLQADINFHEMIIEKSMPSENTENVNEIISKEVFRNTDEISDDNFITVSSDGQEDEIVRKKADIENQNLVIHKHEIKLKGENRINRKAELVKENNTCWKMELIQENNVKRDLSDETIKRSYTPTTENTLEEIEADSGIGSLILDSKIQEDITDENVISNLSTSSDESSSSNERKRKFSENDILVSEESDFEPIDDLSFIALDSDSDTLVKEETDDSEKEIMTEYIECDDNSVVIKYWIAT